MNVNPTAGAVNRLASNAQPPVQAESSATVDNRPATTHSDRPEITTRDLSAGGKDGTTPRLITALPPADFDKRKKCDPVTQAEERAAGLTRVAQLTVTDPRQFFCYHAGVRGVSNGYLSDEMRLLAHNAASSAASDMQPALVFESDWGEIAVLQGSIIEDDKRTIKTRLEYYKLTDPGDMAHALDTIIGKLNLMRQRRGETQLLHSLYPNGPMAAVSNDCPMETLSELLLRKRRQHSTERRDRQGARGTQFKHATHNLGELHEEDRLIFPQCAGRAAPGYFFPQSDGKIRRVPRDFSKEYLRVAHSKGITSMLHEMGHEKHSEIYDADQRAIHQVVAEYKIDDAQSTVSFDVAGQPTESLASWAGVYLFGDNRYMLPQLRVYDALFACEEMLLAEGKPAEKVLEQIGNYQAWGYSPGTKEIEFSLKSRSGSDPVTFHSGSMGTPGNVGKSINFLQRQIEALGPCIFINGGHPRILDGIEQIDGKYVFTVRDPFCGSVLKIYNHCGFWHGPSEEPSLAVPSPNDQCDWEAIFLSRK
ncbi:MAG: hypothetical protein ACRYG5_19160 [Janthinobacterium lividum]